MRNQTQQPPADQFLLVEEAARSLNLDSKLLRLGIACGLVPVRRDNVGAIRVHAAEIPTDLAQRINDVDVQPQLQISALADEVSTLEKAKADVELQRNKLEALVVRQGAALSRYSELMDGIANSDDGFSGRSQAAGSAIEQQLARREAHVQQLTSLLERTFKAIDIRDQQVIEQSIQLSTTTDKAFSLLERAVHEGELSAAQLNSLKQELGSSADTMATLKQELSERNSVINNQHGLMERMVTLAERTASEASAGSAKNWSARNGSARNESATDESTTTKRRKRSLWQRLQLRLWGGGRGI